MSAIIEFALKPSINEVPAYIELNKLLKVLQLVESGAMANQMIVDGLVRLNGSIDLRKRAKVKAGDKVTFDGKLIQVF